jgi:hypothetical protein
VSARFEGPEWCNEHRIREEWATWLATFPWSHFATYTFAEPCTSPRAALGRLKAHHRRLRTRRHVESRSFAVVEGSESVRLHLHALSSMAWSADRARLHSSGMVQEPVHRTAYREWFERWGRCRVSPLRGDAIGASFYVAKYLVKEGEQPSGEPRWMFLPSGLWGATVPEC